MEIHIHIGPDSLEAERPFPRGAEADCGAEAVFRGMVRATENGRPITALEYQAYQPMAEREIRRLIEVLAKRYPCQAVAVRHRIGMIPVGETAIIVRVAATHRA